MADHKTYLGDGVYAEFDVSFIWIYTSNGIEKSDRIAIEPEVMNNLQAFAQRFWNCNQTGKFEL